MTYSFLKVGDSMDVFQLAADIKFAFDTAQGGDPLSEEVAARIAKRIDALDGEDGIVHVKSHDPAMRERIEQIVREEFKDPSLQRNMALWGNSYKYGEVLALPGSLVSALNVRPGERHSVQFVAEKIRDGAMAFGERISLDQALEIAQAIERNDGRAGGGISCRADSYSDPVFQRYIAKEFPHLNSVAIGKAVAVAVGPTNIRYEIPERFRSTPLQDMLDEFKRLGVPEEQLQITQAGMGPSASDLLELNRQLEFLRPLVNSEAQAHLNQLKADISSIVQTMNVRDAGQAQQAEERLLRSGLLDQLRVLRVAVPNLCSQLRAGLLSSEQIRFVPTFLGRWATQTRVASAALSQPVGAVMQLGRAQLGASVLGQAQAAANQVVNAAPPDPRVKTAAMVAGAIVLIGALVYFGINSNES